MKARPRKTGMRISEQDRQLFISALDAMPPHISKESPETHQESHPHSSNRRMKLLRQGRIVPEVELDIHGLTREEAVSRVRYFLQDAVYHSRKTALIITGRGNRSGEGPVLRKEVERYLAGEGRIFAADWCGAAPRHGGEGAIIVYLRGRKR